MTAQREEARSKSPGAAAADAGGPVGPHRLRASAASGAIPRAAAGASESVIFGVEGMTCVACSGRVERALRSVAGVTDAAVNLIQEEARVEGNADFPELARAVKRAGYKLVREKGATHQRTGRTLLAAIALTAPIVVGAMGPMVGLHVGLLSEPWLQFALATPVQLVIGHRFYKGSYHALRGGAANMDVLVALGTSAAYLYSVAALLLPIRPVHMNVYFETSALLITFILAGKFLEEKAKGHTSEAVKRLARLRAKEATVLREGREVQVPVEAVAAGDVVLLRPGDKVPVDGKVIEGTSAVDESIVTGESIPVAKEPGDAVIGSTMNGPGLLRVRATSVGEDSVLSSIIRLVKEAQTQKAPIQRFADRVSAVFVPIVVGIALATFLFWYSIGAPRFLDGSGLIAGRGAFLFALLAATAVTLISCPCALGLATPTAIMVGTGKGAEQGILIRGGEALEAARNVDTVVFDKTGTLTLGSPQVMQVRLAAGGDRKDLLRLAASAERASTHPLAAAVVRAAEREGMDLVSPSGVEETPGRGVKAAVGDRSVHVGSLRFLRESGIEVAPLQPLADAARREGRTVVAAALDGRASGILEITDAIRPEAKAALAELAAMGVRTVMLTGDNEQTAAAVARDLGIPEFRAEVMPDRKLSEIRQLQAEGAVVSFVGDGVNDAPALEQADVGIAMGSATDIAAESGDILLVSNDLRHVAAAIRLSRATLRKIKQNLFWALAYNVAAIPVAAGVLFPFTGLLLRPEIAGLAMALSSVSVVGNSLLLRAHRPRDAPSAPRSPLASSRSA